VSSTPAVSAPVLLPTHSFDFCFSDVADDQLASRQTKNRTVYCTGKLPCSYCRAQHCNRSLRCCNPHPRYTDDPRDPRPFQYPSHLQLPIPPLGIKEIRHVYLSSVCPALPLTTRCLQRCLLSHFTTLGSNRSDCSSDQGWNPVPPDSYLDIHMSTPTCPNPIVVPTPSMKISYPNDIFPCRCSQM
jgi:hypothetical protein